jgi:hypothetical protein
MQIAGICQICGQKISEGLSEKDGAAAGNAQIERRT